MKSFDEIKARAEANRDANLETERNAEGEVRHLQRELRNKASTDSFAWECWDYYRKNYMSNPNKSALFSLNYLKDALAHV